MSLLKYAYDLGYNAAIKEAAMTPAQMQAAQLAGGAGGGLAGAAGGSLLGKYLGERVGDAFDFDPERAGVVGGGIGGVLGAGTGALLGSQLPRAIGKTTPQQTESDTPSPMDVPTSAEESALGALPVAYGDYDPYAEEMYQQEMAQPYPQYDEYGYGDYYDEPGYYGGY